MHRGKKPATAQSGFPSLTRPIRPLLTILNCHGGGLGDHTRAPGRSTRLPIHSPIRPSPLHTAIHPLIHNIKYQKALSSPQPTGQVIYTRARAANWALGTAIKHKWNPGPHQLQRQHQEKRVRRRQQRRQRRRRRRWQQQRRQPRLPTKSSTTPAPALERRTSNPTPDANPTRNNYPAAIDLLLHAPRVAPQTMAPTRNETNDPYDAEGEEEPQNARPCRRRTEDYKTHRHRRLFNAGTEKPIPPASTEAMDTSDDCPGAPGPAAEPASPRQTLTTVPETMDTNEDLPGPTSETVQPAETPVAPKPANWLAMNRNQRKHWKTRQGTS
jgi:hypothetical protein